MSSIYRKGRDGYYYYQTYVYNPESKKKDKRIFHALRTKDLDEARSKQYEFDIKYDKQRQDYSDSKNLSIKFSPRSAMVVCFGAITLTILIFYSFKTNTLEQNKDCDKIEIIDISKLLSDVIRCILNGDSISKLFKL